MALYRHTVLGTSPSESWSWTLHTESAGSLASAQSTWDSAIGTLWTGALDAIYTADIVIVETTTASLDQGTGQQISRASDDVTLPGVNAGEMLPFQCAPVVTLTTDTATRGGRGRFYLPPPASSVLDTGRLSAATVTSIVSAVDGWLTALDGGGLSPVIYGRAAGTTLPITGGSVGDVIDTQRRRRNKLIETRSALTVP